MGKNIKHISDLRIPRPAPDKIVGDDGKFLFGTYSTPFKDLNMLDAKNPVCGGLTKWFKKMRLKDWEAVEVAFDEGFMVSAIYSMGFISFNVLIFFDKKENKTYSWQVFAPSHKVKNHWTLVNSVKSLKINDENDFVIKNNFEKGEVKFDAKITDKKNGSAEVNVKFKSFSDASNVCIPFPKGNNRALYSHKEVFNVDGYLKFNGRTLKANSATLGIIDDHKGYYPYKMHYYWVTGMGIGKVNGKDVKMAFNLTQNQSIDPFNYNENLIWLENKSYILPPVVFNVNDKCWHAKDDKGYVDVKFFPSQEFKISQNAGLIKIRYIAPSGRLEGYVKDYDGNKYIVDGLTNMGEDKTYWI